MNYLSKKNKKIWKNKWEEEKRLRLRNEIFGLKREERHRVLVKEWEREINYLIKMLREENLHRCQIGGQKKKSYEKSKGKKNHKVCCARERFFKKSREIKL